MERKEQIVIAIIVVLLVILAGLVYALLNQKTEPTQAQKMMLKPSELGPGWDGSDITSGYGSPGDLGISSISRWTFGRQNQSYPMYIEIVIYDYDSTFICQSEYINYSQPFLQEPSCENTTLGDGGIAWNSYYDLPVETGGFPQIIFHDKNVLCFMSVIPVNPYAPVYWWKGTLTYFATAQLQKIDQNLG